MIEYIILYYIIYIILQIYITYIICNVRGLATRIVPKDSIEDCGTSIVDPSDKILDAGWIDFILRPVFEQKSLDRPEEVVIGDGGLDFIVGGEV